MKLLGVLIVINALVVCFYWVSGAGQNKAWVVMVCGLAILVGGFFAIASQGSKLTISNVGSLEALAETAKIDADEITKIRRRVESQSATIDLVAEKATRVEELTAEARQVIDFAVTVQAAQADDRNAYEALRGHISRGSSFSVIAVDVVAKINGDWMSYQRPPSAYLPHLHPLLTARTNVEKWALYQPLPIVYRPHGAWLVVRDNEANDTNPVDRLRYAATILRSDPSIKATRIAADYLAEKANISAQFPASIPMLLDWVDNYLKSSGASPKH